MSTDAPTPTYETVEPLIDRSRNTGETMEYVFRCPVTGFEATGSAPLAQFGHAPVESWTLKRSLSPKGLLNPRFEAQNAAENAANRVIPLSGTVAHYATSARGIFRGEKERRAAAEGSPGAQQQGVQALALAAFDTVAGQFAWDGARWVKAGV